MKNKKTTYKDLGKLRQAYLDAGYKNYEVAEHLGIHPVHLSGICTGVRGVNSNVLNRYITLMSQIDKKVR